MPLTPTAFDALPLNLNKSGAHRGRESVRNENGGHMDLRFRISKGALSPSSLYDDPHRLRCCLVVDHSDYIEPFTNVGQVQGLVARPCESANQTAIEAV